MAPFNDNFDFGVVSVQPWCSIIETCVIPPRACSSPGRRPCKDEHPLRLLVAGEPFLPCNRCLPFWSHAYQLRILKWSNSFMLSNTYLQQMMKENLKWKKQKKRTKDLESAWSNREKRSRHKKMMKYSIL